MPKTHKITEEYSAHTLCGLRAVKFALHTAPSKFVNCQACKRQMKRDQDVKEEV